MVWNKEVNSVQFKPAEETETHIVVSWLCGLERERERARDTLNSRRRFFFCCFCVLSSRSSRGTNSREFKWAEASALLQFTTADPCVRMNSNSKSVNSTAIKAEIKRHESLQSAINRLSKQFERVVDQQLRSGLKVYLHSIQGKLIFLQLSLWCCILGGQATYYLSAKLVEFFLTDYQNFVHGLMFRILTLMHFLIW